MIMKVLHITHDYPRPYDQLDGIAVHKQIRAQQEQGCEQKVISPTAWAPFPIKHLSHKWKLYSQVPFRNIIEGIEAFHPRQLIFPKLFMQASHGALMSWSIRKLVREIYCDFQFDIIHAHMAYPDGYAGMLASMRYRKPLVVTLQATDLDSTAKRSKICSSLLYKVFRYADKIISPSPRLVKDLGSRFNITSTHIGYGIDESEIFSNKTELHSRYEDQRVILTVSRLLLTKGVDLNIKAIRRLVDKYGNLLLIVVGDGPERFNLERLTRELNLERHVKFLGHLPHESVMEYMSACEVFSMPSWQETFGLVYIEAMAHAKPVIAIRGQGVDGIVIHGKTGMLAKPNDVDSVIEVMDFLLSHPNEAKTIGKRARKLVLEIYTYKKNAERTINIYNEVLYYA